jgi:uncharacterized membrane protein YraQ (UPF0718 family)
MGPWLGQVGEALVGTFFHNWPILLIGTVAAASVRTFVSEEKLSALLRRSSRWAILLSVGAAVLTPLCSCGTMAVVLAMLVSVVPWGPVIAFIVSSPLTSPAQFFYVAGFMGWGFAWFHMLACSVLGLGAGFVADRLDRAGWLAGQARYQVSQRDSVRRQDERVGTQAAAAATAETEAAAALNRPTGAVGLGTVRRPPGAHWPLVKTLAREIGVTAYRLVPRWFLFAAIGYGFLYAIPSGLTETLMGSQRAWSVPVAALLGLPLYINAETSIPLVKSLVDAGMGLGAAMTFFITGPATSVGALAGLTTIARSRVIALVLVTILVGAILAGISFDAIIPLL